MQLIHSLTSGISGAALGKATIYRRGTSTRAVLYADFEGALHPQNGSDVDLDSYGGATVYVNELVEVIVKDADGGTIRDFVEGEASPNVEVRSLSFTGTDYDSGATGVGKPTTVQAVLDRWTDSAGAPDFEVSVGGVATPLDEAISALSGIFYNVKAPQFGAIGDGLADDGPAIQAALNAASGSGGTVFFPPGTYKTTTTMAIASGTSLLGSGYSSSRISCANASNANAFSVSGSSSTEFRGLGIGASVPNTGKVLTFTNTTVSFVGCYLNQTVTNFTGTVLAVTGTGTLDIRDSIIVSSGSSCVDTGNTSAGFSASGSIFSGGGVLNTGLVKSCTFRIWGCSFFLTNSGGTAACVLSDGTTTSPVGTVVCCQFTASVGGGTKYAFQATSVNSATTSLTESGNSFVAGFTKLYFGWGADTANPRIQPFTRDLLFRQTTDNTATVDVQADQYGTMVVTRTAAGAQAFTSTVGAVGSKFTLVIYNNSGGNLTFTFSTGFAAGTASIVTVATGKIASQRFEAMYIAGGAAWVPISAETRTT